MLPIWSGMICTALMGALAAVHSSRRRKKSQSKPLSAKAARRAEKSCSSLKWGVAAIAIAALIGGAGCKKKTIDPFPASNSVAGWDKTSDTRVFAAKDLWQYVDGDSEQYIQAGVVSTSTADYKYQGQLEAVVDVYTMGDSAGARKILESEQSKDAKSVTLGDAGIAYQQSVTFRKGPYLVRIVSYESTPDGPQALLALAHGVESKL
jgi:hypothetical protein